MPENPESVSTEYQLYFGGENDLDAATLGNVLLNTVVLTEEANKEIGIGQPLEIKVKSNRKGSFVVDLDILARNTTDTLIPLITTENIKIVAASIGGIVKLVAGVLSLRKQLKDETPVKVENKGDEVVITTGSHNEIHVNKPTYHLYFGNERAKQSVQEIFKTLNNDKTVEDFSILDENSEKLFEVEREEFPLLTTSLSTTAETTRKVTKTAQLNIVALTFKTDNKWKFIYRGFPITASISDDTFRQKVIEGEPFANGDALEVELEIEQEFDRAANTYINKKHNIKRVIRHIPRPKQMPLLPVDDQVSAIPIKEMDRNLDELD